MQPDFPPRGTPEYLTYLEEWLIKERVDNERQWRLLRQVTGLLSGLNPIQPIVDIGFPQPPGGSGSGSGSGSSCICDLFGVVASQVVISGLTGACGTAYNGTWPLMPITNCLYEAAGGHICVGYDGPTSSSGTWTAIMTGTGITGCNGTGSAAGSCSISPIGTLTIGLTNGATVVLS